MGTTIPYSSVSEHRVASSELPQELVEVDQAFDLLDNPATVERGEDFIVKAKEEGSEPIRWRILDRLGELQEKNRGIYDDIMKQSGKKSAEHKKMLLRTEE